MKTWNCVLLSPPSFPFWPSLFPCVCFIVWWFSFCPLFPSLPPLSHLTMIWNWSRMSRARMTPGRSMSYRWDVWQVFSSFEEQKPLSTMTYPVHHFSEHQIAVRLIFSFHNITFSILLPLNHSCAQTYLEADQLHYIIILLLFGLFTGRFQHLWG